MPSARWHNIKALHEELWQWCADNPEKYKTEWPGWAEHRDMSGFFCFACLFGCAECPCWWGSYTYGGPRFCGTFSSVYRKYCRAIEKGHKNLARLYALRVRDAWVCSYD